MSRYQLHASLGYNLSLAARLQERRLDGALKPEGLTRTSWCILLAVGNEELKKPSEIARFVGIDRTATSRALRGMEASDLIRRKSGQKDRRSTEVTLTPKGRRAIDRLTPFAEANNDWMTSKLTADENKRLMALLGKLNADEETGLAVI